MINSPLPCCEKCQKAGPTTFKISLSWHGGIFYKQFHLLIGITKLTFFRSLLVVKSAPALKFSPCFLWLISEFWARLHNLLKGQEISEWKYEVVVLPKTWTKNLKKSVLSIQDRIFQIFSFILWAMRRLHIFILKFPALRKDWLLQLQKATDALKYMNTETHGITGWFLQLYKSFNFDISFKRCT